MLMKKWIKWVAGFSALSAVMLIVGTIMGNLNANEKTASPVSIVEKGKPIVVVIDAGHGGEDGGCVAIDGTLEKDLNLMVSEKVYAILKAGGVNTVMTRNDDRMLYDCYDELEDYDGIKKTYDLKNRVRFAKETGCKLFCSIHMNKFSDSNYSGLQVYCSTNDSDSITAGLRIQSYVKDYLQPDNERQIKYGKSDIYVLHRAQMPAVLVECGFLSNMEELSLLKDSQYQKKLSLCITAGIMDSLCNFRT